MNKKEQIMPKQKFSPKTVRNFTISNLTSQANLSPREFVDMMPDVYFKRMNFEQIKNNYKMLSQFKSDPENMIGYKGKRENVLIHKFNHEILERNLLNLPPSSKTPYSLYRITQNPKQNFMLTEFYDKIESNTKFNDLNIPKISDRKQFFTDKKGVIIKSLVIHYIKYSKIKSKIVMYSINNSRTTIIKNLIETFYSHRLSPTFVEIWRSKEKNCGNIKSMYTIELFFGTILSPKIINSLKNDFTRYLHTYIKPLSIFDMIGPKMVGPSSSHTAGANKIGQTARNIISTLISSKSILEIKGIEIKLIGSFRDTGVGHQTPAAVGGGLWGLSTYNSNMLKHGHPDFLKEKGIVIDGTKISFQGYTQGTAEDDKKYKQETNNNIAEIIIITKDSKHIITGFSIGGGNIEIRYFNNRKLDEPITGKKDFLLKEMQIIPLPENMEESDKNIIHKIYKDMKAPCSDFVMPFNSFEELSAYIEEKKKKMIEVVLETESHLQGTSNPEIYERMEGYWAIMQKSIFQGLKDQKLSLLKLTGNDSNKIDKFVNNNSIFNNIFGKAIGYATAVNEINAKSGVIVACPTAGSCGILPGILKSYQETTSVNSKKLLEAGMVSGFLAMILFNDVTTAGADYGCQAEVGAAAAMAAAAIAYLEGGDHQVIINAFILAIKNSLGLICDPVAGLVEVPCVKRNGIYTSMALSSAVMALSGVRSLISPDEVILTMREVGEKLHRDYKETAGAGLAKTRDGKMVEREFDKEVKKFFK